MNPDDVVDMAREEARAVNRQQLQRALRTADAHVINRARREYVKAQHGTSTRIIESIIQENAMTDQTSNHNTDDQEQEQHPTDRYPFPAHWPITGPFANTDQE